MTARDMKIKIKFAKCMLESENNIGRRIVERFKVGGKKTRWSRKVEEYLGNLGMNWYRVIEMSQEQIVSKVNRWETERWKRTIRARRSLMAYRHKNCIGNGQIYDNS